MEENVQTVTQETPTEQVVQAQPTIQELNLIAMRKKLDEAERRAAEYEARAQQYQQHVQPTQQQQREPEVDDLGVDNEDYVQAKYIKNANKKFSTKLSSTDQKIQQLEEKLAYFEAKVGTDSLKDFEDVVSADNLKTLERLYPDDYQSVISNPSLKARSKTAYNMIKNYGIISSGNPDHIESKLASNKQKPQAAALANPKAPQTPLTRLGDYDRRVIGDDEAKRIMREVHRKKMSW
jgi:hypothetical protein